MDPGSFTAMCHVLGRWQVSICPANKVIVLRKPVTPMGLGKGLPLALNLGELPSQLLVSAVAQKMWDKLGCPLYHLLLACVLTGLLVPPPWSLAWRERGWQSTLPLSLDSALSGCVTLDRLLHLSEPQL